MVNGELVPNGMAPVVRQAFHLRGEGKSQGDIARATGFGYSTVCTILRSRIYLGEVQLRGEWSPGRHEAIITPEEFAAAHRGRVKGRRRGRDLLAGRVRCGRCKRVMTMEDNGSGHVHYRCRHRGEGCKLPRRSVRGLTRAAVLGLALIGQDERLRDAIRQQLVGPGVEPRRGRRRGRQAAPNALAALVEERRKLLRLHYANKISGELFGGEEARLSAQIDALRAEEAAEGEETQRAEEVRRGFEEIAAYLAHIDVEAIWDASSEEERRVLLDELLDGVEVHDDHLEVIVRGAPRLNVTLKEVGLNSQTGEDWSCRRAEQGIAGTDQHERDRGPDQVVDVQAEEQMGTERRERRDLEGQDRLALGPVDPGIGERRLGDLLEPDIERADDEPEPEQLSPPDRGHGANAGAKGWRRAPVPPPGVAWVLLFTR